MRTTNHRIKNVGLFFLAHYNRFYIRCNFDCITLDIPNNRLLDFCNLFPEVDFENGEFISSLKGQVVRITFNDDMRIHAIHHIVDDLSYIVNG